MRRHQLEKERQEREAFDEHKRQSRQWFTLRLVVGYLSLLLLLVVLILCIRIIASAADYPFTVVLGASGALFGDVLGLVAAILKIALNPELQLPLLPLATSLDEQSKAA